MKKRILIVDDDSDLLVLLRLIFEKQDYEVLTVDSGEDCLNELERGFKGIILMDLMMPFMDGWATLKKMVKKGYIKDNIISIISAKTCPDHTKMKEFKPYIHNYINKPFNVDQLVSDIAEINNL
jgi:DNA-binding response OmpR family regulator